MLGMIKVFYFLFLTLLCLGVHAYPMNPCFFLQKTFKKLNTQNKEKQFELNRPMLDFWLVLEEL
jgi:hypothetical protein